jgi:hypothetical protein
MSISKKIRFEVFKRDNFTCGYCGKTPPAAILEIDHIEPTSRGGSDDINNLITSCFDCNRGKTNIRLNRIAPGIAVNLEVLQEKEAQLKEYNKWVVKINRRIMADVEKISGIFSAHFEGYVLSDNFKQNSIKRFLALLPFSSVADAMTLSCLKMNNRDISIRYFCGICWKMIKSGITDINAQRSNDGE